MSTEGGLQLFGTHPRMFMNSDKANTKEKYNTNWILDCQHVLLTSTWLNVKFFLGTSFSTGYSRRFKIQSDCHSWSLKISSCISCVEMRWLLFHQGRIKSKICIFSLVVPAHHFIHIQLLWYGWSLPVTIKGFHLFRWKKPPCFSQSSYFFFKIYF